MNYKGIIIEESLEDKDILNKISILNTKVEEVTSEHKTPWIKRWTLHTVEIPEDIVRLVATEISYSLDSKHSWYADFKNNNFHFIIFRDKVFKVDRSNPKRYNEVAAYGMNLGIPIYQLDFSPVIKEWKR